MSETSPAFDQKNAISKTYQELVSQVFRISQFVYFELSHFYAPKQKLTTNMVAPPGCSWRTITSNEFNSLRHSWSDNVYHECVPQSRSLVLTTDTSVAGFVTKPSRLLRVRHCNENLLPKNR